MLFAATKAPKFEASGIAEKRDLRPGDAGTRRVGAGRRLDDALPSLNLRPRVFGAKAGDRAVDQALVCRRHRFCAEAEAVHDAGAEVLDEHVGLADEATGDLEVVRLLEVEDDAALAALEDGVGLVAPARSAGRVDADDLGALVGEHHRRQRPGEVLPEVEHADTIENSCHHCPPARSVALRPR